MISLLHRRRALCKALETVRPRLYRLAWSWCRDADEAGDLVQEACLKGMERNVQLRDPERAEQWLVRIMSNLFLDRVRARRDHVDIGDLDLAASDGDPVRETLRDDAVERVRAAISELSVDQRMVVTLVDLMGYSYAEVSAALDIPVGTVMSRLCRARRRLKECLLADGEQRRPRRNHLRLVQ